MDVASKEKFEKIIDELERKLAEAEDTFDAIKYNKVDALVVSTDRGEEIFTLQGADRPYRNFLEQMNEGAVTVSHNGIILYSNKAFADFLNVPLEKIIGTPLADYSDLQNRKTLLYLLNQEFIGKTEVNFCRSDGSIISLYLSKTILDIPGIESVICLVATDLTEKKQSEEIVAAEKLARSILEQAAEAIVVCDENMKVIRSNKAAENLAGETILYRNFDDVFQLLDKRKKKISIKEIRWEDTETEASLITKGKDKIHLIVNMGKLNGHGNNILGYVISLTNVTRHIRAEEKLNASLHEKTVMLKEIHHRVKNNLQIISSLLALQSNAVKDDTLAEVLTECRNRVSSMAMIHQKLYESKSFSSISIPDYLRELIPSLSSSYHVTKCKIDLDFPSKDLFLTIEDAIPLGLIMNELITNTLKHAFNGSAAGKINVSLKATPQEITLLISDNGAGFPKEFDFYNPPTLGLQLVHTLVQQLEGKIELLDQPGTNIKISIPIR